MIIPKMPEGYVLLQEIGFWYILKDTGPFMKRLFDPKGDYMRFECTTSSLAEAATYAQKHKDLNLTYDQSVPEVQS